MAVVLVLLFILWRYGCPDMSMSSSRCTGGGAVPIHVSGELPPSLPGRPSSTPHQSVWCHECVCLIPETDRLSGAVPTCPAPGGRCRTRRRPNCSLALCSAPRHRPRRFALPPPVLCIHQSSERMRVSLSACI